MNILVTGGAGFMDSNVVRWLLANQPDVRVIKLDALTCGGRLEGLKDVKADPGYTFVHGDICPPWIVAEAMHGVDLVLHLTAEPHVDCSILADAPFLRTHVLGTQTLLAAALALGVKRFVQVSPDEVDGELLWRDPSDGDPRHASSPRTRASHRACPTRRAKQPRICWRRRATLPMGRTWW